MTIASRLAFGDVVLVPFPFTDQSGMKKRPAVIVSTAGYNVSRRDVVIMAITSQVRTPLGYGEALVHDWEAAGLIKTSVFKPVLPPSTTGSSYESWATFRLPTSRPCASCLAR
jgi:mRNA interferase MazF